ncbi:hypothetical protein UFOVP1299_2 [uncultured Caudovirales phage]|uniref:Uncharacterized protein n=1 Tax=uncultured Caudovirales phage TaxID=2100421 RepID=A0A6J5RLW9_9CAUD|nr:hypothetical protein UFOVP1299_2 [uncultured Caudovirales phage]
MSALEHPPQYHIMKAGSYFRRKGRTFLVQSVTDLTGGRKRIHYLGICAECEKTFSASLITPTHSGVSLRCRDCKKLTGIGWRYRHK